MSSKIRGVDGSGRKRRQGDSPRARWYAKYRNYRFARRMGFAK
jgi:hypothetical protein